MQAEVGIGRNGGVEVNEGLSIAVGGPCGSGEVVELGVGFEGVGGVGSDFGTIAWGLLVRILEMSMLEDWPSG